MRLFKRHTAAALAAAAILGFGSGAAEAAPISWDITYDPANVFFGNNGNACTGTVAGNTVSSTTCQSLQFVFNLADTVTGFDASTDALASGSLTFTFFDDNNPGPDANGIHDETVDISLDGILTWNDFDAGNGYTVLTPYTTSPFDVLANLADGQLTVLLALSPVNGNNDFFFVSSRLIARGERTESQEEDPPPTGGVPEPASLLLFGMAGLAARRVVRRAH